MIFKRATIPLIIVFVMGLLGFVLSYIPHPASHTAQEEIESWFKIIGGFGLFIGAYSLIHLHVTRIRRQSTGWAYSGFVLVGAAVMIALGLWNAGYGPLKDIPATADKAFDIFDWGYTYILMPCGATIFSILAFFMASAAFRTFRARNLASALLLIAAIIVMFGRVPISEWVCNQLFGSKYKDIFGIATDTIMEVPNLAAKRGILLGISLGGIAQSLRILFGIERSYLGAD